MKKVLKVFVLTLILTLCAASATVFAKSSYKTGLKKISEAISGYEYSLLFSYQQMSYEEDNNLDVSKDGTINVKLNKDLMTRAAILSSLNNSEELECLGYEDLGYGEKYWYSVNKEFKDQGMKLFGKKLKASYLSSENYSVWDAYKDEKYGPCIFDYIVETDTGFEYKKESYSKKGKKYYIKKQAYFGH